MPMNDVTIDARLLDETPLLDGGAPPVQGFIVLAMPSLTMVAHDVARNV